MPIRLVPAALVLLLAAGPAAAQSMNAEAFHQRAAKLQSKGAAAIFSMGEVKRLVAEGKAAGEAARERRLAAIRAGQKAAYCPPDGPQTMDSNEFMARLSAIPAADRARIDMTEAMVRILKAKYPCAS